jgi:hypothetical protein
MIIISNVQKIISIFADMIDIQIYNIHDDVTILNHIFHGLEDIQNHVEMSLYKDWSRGQAWERQPKESCEIHVGEMWMPYPCFDWEDSVNENRTYQNYVLRSRPITQEDMQRLSELKSHTNEQRVWNDVPEDMLPMIYYRGDGKEMLVAVRKETIKEKIANFLKKFYCSSK